MNTPVSFQLAKLLKEKGFEQKTKSYTEDGKLVTVSLTIRRFNTEKNYYPAPTIAEVVMWLYEKHGIFIQLFPAGENKEWRFYSKIIVNDNGWIKIQHQISKFVNTPTEAYEAGIQYIIENLL